jgi:GAF domain-containing protein
VEILLQVTTELSSSLDLDRVLTRALQLVTESIKADKGSIFLVDLETEQLIYRAALGRATPLPPGGQPAPFRRHEGLVGWALKARQGAVIPDLARPALATPARPWRRAAQRAVVPLMATRTRWAS